MKREDEILNWVANGLTQFADELKGYSIVLFGSRAQGTARERSDFDFGVIGESDIPLTTFFKIATFMDELPTLYRLDWVDLNRASNALRRNALQHAKVIYG